MQYIDFSSRSDLVGYIPQIKSFDTSPFPFLACDIDSIDQVRFAVFDSWYIPSLTLLKSLIGWNDASHSYDYYNLIFDIPIPGMFRDKVIIGNTRSGAATIQDQLSFRLRRRGGLQRPIFSIVAHYPPPWALQLRVTKDA